MAGKRDGWQVWGMWSEHPVPGQAGKPTAAPCPGKPTHGGAAQRVLDRHILAAALMSNCRLGHLWAGKEEGQRRGFSYRGGAGTVAFQSGGRTANLLKVIPRDGAGKSDCKRHAANPPACLPHTHDASECGAYLQCVWVALWVDARVVQRLKVQVGGACRGKG